MPRRPLPALLFALSLLASPPTAFGADHAAAKAPASFAQAFQRGAAWSVGVYIFVPGDEEPRVGAGFLVDDKGHIATAAHLLGEAQQILVALPDKRLLAGELLGRDEAADIALLRVDPPPRPRPVFARGGSLRVGDWVMAVGEPFGLEHSVSAGIVSGKDRHFGDDGELVLRVGHDPGNFVQKSA